MNPFELINADLYRDAPFAVPCPHCDSVAAYAKDDAKLYSTHASYVAAEFGGAEPDVYAGTILGACNCTNQKCQERVHFIGSYKTERDDSYDPPGYGQTFLIKYFFPPVPLITIPQATPQKVVSILNRSFAPAFMDQSASGNLLRSAIERLLTERGIPRFGTSQGKRIYLSLHSRIDLLPQELQPYKDDLLAIKWIGNEASHDDLSVKSLRLAYEIVESLLDNLYGTKKRELSRAIKRVNRRKRP